MHCGYHRAKIRQDLILRSSKAGEKMKPKAATPQCELFGAQLSELLNPKHPLYVLAERIDWPEFDAAIDACYAADIGRPGVNTRLMVGLVYLKHAFNESDNRWSIGAAVVWFADYLRH